MACKTGPMGSLACSGLPPVGSMFLGLPPQGSMMGALRGTGLSLELWGSSWVPRMSSWTQSEWKVCTQGPEWRAVASPEVASAPTRQATSTFCAGRMGSSLMREQTHPLSLKMVKERMDAGERGPATAKGVKGCTKGRALEEQLSHEVSSHV